MASKRSVYTEAVLEVVGRLNRVREQAQKSKAIPFMEERVTAQEFRARFGQMLSEERRAVIQKMGLEQVMKRLDRRAAE